MSIDIDWKTLTEGPDGLALAETIRDFIHERFQHIPFPKLLRSVTVHKFDFGSVAPQIELKDVCDPLPDFYENDDEDDAAPEDGQAGNADTGTTPGHVAGSVGVEYTTGYVHHHAHPERHGRATSPTLSRGATPGILGGTSNLGCFHLPLSAGLSGTQTPLAAVAGAHFPTSVPIITSHHHQHDHSESFSSISPPSTATPPSRPISRDQSYFDQHQLGSAILDESGTRTPPAAPQDHDRSPEDLQVVYRVTYSGDVKLSLTADVFLDYPMPSFVGIPLKLRITGMTFDGVGILAYIKKRAHLCFLAPEDAEALVGGEVIMESPLDEATGGSSIDPVPRTNKVGALLEDIKIESEMGESESGRQVLKNVGKIEKFVLEQVQRIFEDEFVYPNFWTLLV